MYAFIIQNIQETKKILFMYKKQNPDLDIYKSVSQPGLLFRTPLNTSGFPVISIKILDTESSCRDPAARQHRDPIHPQANGSCFLR